MTDRSNSGTGSFDSGGDLSSGGTGSSGSGLGSSNLGGSDLGMSTGGDFAGGTGLGSATTGGAMTGDAMDMGSVSSGANLGSDVGSEDYEVVETIVVVPDVSQTTAGATDVAQTSGSEADTEETSGGGGSGLPGLAMGALAGAALGAAASAILGSAGGSGTSTIERSIEVDAPVSTVYNQWTQFEEFPRFMQGVERVRQLDDKRLHWHADIGFKEKEWDAEIIDQVPDQHIAWSSTTGARNGGAVGFQSLGANRTRVTLTIDYDPEGLLENVGDSLGFVSRRVEGDLERFKEYIESRGGETGAWRGEIHAGQ